MLASILLALAGAVFWGLAWRGAPPPPIERVPVEGRVSLRGLDGAELVPERVEVRVFTREALGDPLAAWLAGVDEERAGVESSLAEARRQWEDANSVRREAARIAQVAEKSNAADLPLCRLRLERAEENARHAYERLEHLSSRGDTAADASSVLEVLPAARLTLEADDSGRFSLSLPPDGDHVLVLSASAGSPSGERFVWLHDLDDLSGGPLEFSSGSLVTLERVRAWLSSR